MMLTTMTIEQLWLAMEAEGENNVAWLTQFARPQTGYPLLAALEQATKARALLIPVTKAVLPPRRDWPECRGLEMFSISLGLQPHLGVRLRDRACSDVFTVLAEDVALRVTTATGAKQAVKLFLNRLLRWQKFLAAGRGGLTVEQQRGLYGELHTLKSHLLPALNTGPSVKGWRAPKATHQDFQFATGSVEVKTSVAKQPQAVRITSERQLDDTGIPALFLHVVVLDERLLESPDPLSIESTLPGIVSGLRACLAVVPQEKELFDDRLLEAGYFDADAPRYEGRCFTLRREMSFRVRRGFPRVVEDDLPAGIGDVNYALDLVACEPFTVPTASILKILNTASPGRGSARRRKNKSKK
jgi:hypothetical protein